MTNSRIAVSQVRTGDTVWWRRGAMTVIETATYNAPYGLPRVAVLVNTPKGTTLCLSFPVRDTVEVVNVAQLAA